jgi:hypothetical protein
MDMAEVVSARGEMESNNEFLPRNKIAFLNVYYMVNLEVQNRYIEEDGH